MPRRFALIATLPFLVAAGSSAATENKLEARYLATFSGMTVGEGALVIEISSDRYSASGSGAVAGAVKLLHNGKGSAAARGAIVDGKIVPVSFSGSSESGRRTDDVHMILTGGTVSEVKMDPPPSRSSRRLPIEDEHRKGVVDPMSAAIMPVPGDGDVTGPAACDRTLEIFDGRHRYDLVLSYERTDQAGNIRGYSGALAVCRVAYRPIAGHNPRSRSTRQAIKNEEMFVWLAPIGDTRVVVPARVSVGSQWGTLIVQATRLSHRTGRRADAGDTKR